MLVLPNDPEAWIVDFDEAFWGWWLADEEGPVGRRSALWQPNPAVSASAAARTDANGESTFRHFLAIHRHGGIEVALGRSGRYEIGPDSAPAFRLLPIVLRIYDALAVQRSAIDRYGIDGPWEITIAFLGTEGSFLGCLGAGWQEPEHRGGPACREKNILLRRELSVWPASGDTQHLVLSLAAAIDNAWGSRHARCKAREGQFNGNLDQSWLRYVY